jgi:hypothetical protein
MPLHLTFIFWVRQSMSGRSLVRGRREAFELVRGVLDSIKSDFVSGVFRVDGPAEKMHPDQWRVDRIS